MQFDDKVVEVDSGGEGVALGVVIEGDIPCGESEAQGRAIGGKIEWCQWSLNWSQTDIGAKLASASR